MPLFNQYGGVGGGISSEPIGGPLAGNSYTPGGYSALNVSIPSAATANAGNLSFTRGAMSGDPVYAAAKGFLNPNDPTAMRDVATRGAEHAVATGLVGSGSANMYTGRLRQYDIERRAALGNQLLSGAYGRTPQPVNPYAQAQLQLEQANMENRRLLDGIQSRYAPSVGVDFGRGGGGGRSAPLVIGGGGTGMAGVNGYQPVQPLAPLAGGGTPAGSGQVNYGYGGPDWNVANQASQFYPGEYAPGTVYFGPNPSIPMPQPTYTADSGDEEDFY